MPSFCIVSSCKRVKQIGDDISFHKFPFHNQEIFKKWVEFVMTDEAYSNDKPSKITKFSSICSQHFTPNDMSHSQQRKNLKKFAVPSIIKKSSGNLSNAGVIPSNSHEITNNLQTYSTNIHENHPQDSYSMPQIAANPANVDHQPTESTEEDCEILQETDDPLNNDCCGLCKSGSCLTVVDDFHVGLIHKCLPLITINENFLQKLCKNCISILETFSMFMDKILTVQNNACQVNYIVPDSTNIQHHRIKVEPLANIEEEVKIPSIQVMDFAQEPRVLTNQFTKKCEILEIVDIKPFNFDGSMQQENYDDEDEIQILSPKQLKVEIDPDEDGSNELEQIMNYVYISQIFLQDHNYTKVPDETVKMECDDDNIESKSQDTTRVCNICFKSFKSFRRLLVHKIVNHRANKSKLKPRKQIVYSEKHQQMRKLCTKIIQQKKQKMVKENENPQPNRRGKAPRKSFDCPICGKIFSGSKNLYQHKISHTVANYSCSLCDKKFKRAHGLKQHFKSIHENEKNFECSMCGHRYLLKADMSKCRHRALKKMS